MNKKLEVYEMRDELIKFFSYDAAEALAEFLNEQDGVFDAKLIASQWKEHESYNDAKLEWMKQHTTCIEFGEGSRGVLVKHFKP